MSNQSGKGAELARGFIRATEGKDLDAMRALFDPDASFWTNITLQDSDLESRLLRIAREFEVFERISLTDPRIDELQNGFVIRAWIDGALHEGGPFRFPICIVADVRNGKIYRLEEYLDMAPVAPILKAMAG